MPKSEIRKHYFKEEYVIIAPNRAKRPHIVEKTEEVADNCHFCPDKMIGETITFRQNNHHGEWEVVSILNKFAAVDMKNDRAFGQAEVIVESRNHKTNINDLSIDHIVKIYNTYIDRFLTLRNIDGIKHVIVFKNEGGKAGASISHSHSQVIALPLLPEKNKNEAVCYNQYRLKKVTCPYCDIIRKEIDSDRVIWQDENFFVLSPYASKTPFGAWFLPKRHINLMSEMTRSEKESLAIAMKLLLGKLDDFDIAYNYFFENGVNSEDYHMFVKLEPRQNIWAGLELGTGIVINTITPEYAAKFYRGEAKIENDPSF